MPTVDIAILVAAVRQAGFPEPEPEYVFHPVRKWRFDLCWVGHKVAFEREGMGPGGTPGRHQRAAGYRSDAHKYNAAQTLGFIVIRGTAAMLRDGSAVAELIAALKARTPQEATGG